MYSLLRMERKFGAQYGSGIEIKASEYDCGVQMQATVFIEPGIRL